MENGRKKTGKKNNKNKELRLKLCRSIFYNDMYEKSSRDFI